MGICEEGDKKKTATNNVEDVVQVDQEKTFSEGGGGGDENGDKLKDTMWEPPQGKDGLYDSSLEKEACGVGFVVSIDGIASQKVSNHLMYTFSLKRCIQLNM